MIKPGDRLYVEWGDNLPFPVEWNNFTVRWVSPQETCFQFSDDRINNERHDRHGTFIVVPRDSFKVVFQNGVNVVGIEQAKKAFPKYQENADITTLVQSDLEQRAILGKAKYGARLVSGVPCNNSKSNLQNLYEELLDACCYLKKQLMEEM